MKRLVLETAGPGSQRLWNRLSEHEVGRPTFRAKRNPVQAQSGVQPQFPYSCMAYDGGGQAQSLEIVAWALRDGMEILQAKVWGAITYLFTAGQNQPYTPIGGTTSYQKPDIQCNINSNTGQLANPQSFLCERIQQMWRGDASILDILNLAYSTLFQFQCGDNNRVYLDDPGCKVPGGATGIYVGYAGSGANLAVNPLTSMGWPLAHSGWSMQTGLLDPSLADTANPAGKPDMGVILNQGRQFRFTLDPTQLSFIASTVAQTSWTTTATAAGGTGIQLWIELVGNLARSLAG